MRLTNRLFHLMAIALILVGACVADAGPSGAIFTTNEAATFVNGNVYDLQEDVYLNGGPRPNAPCTAAGLPEGDYYFQVTDPSGATLLSSDDISERSFRVENGIISMYLGATHGTGTVYGKCGGVTVQLVPFDPTPNPGGEYKVWVTPVIGFDPEVGFVHSLSKTDNFKVVPSDSDVPD